MVKFCLGSKHHRNLLKIGFVSIFDAKRANKYLGTSETRPISLSMEVSEQQKKILDDSGIRYYIVD